MSNDNITTFFKRVTDSPELQQKIKEIYQAEARGVAEKLASLSQEAGTPFTAEDFLAASRARGEEIPDSHLAEVSGGSWLEMANKSIFTPPKGVIDFSDPEPNSPPQKRGIKNWDF